MRRGRAAALAVVLAAALLPGCASILSPYSSSYTCPKKDGYGRCMELETTYKMSLGGGPAGSSGIMPEREIREIQEKLRNGRKLTQDESERLRIYIEMRSAEAGGGKPTLYEQERQKAMVSLLKMPSKPIRAPDKILRVLILPYVSRGDEEGSPGEDSVLHEHRYVYVPVERGEWVVGEYLFPPSQALVRGGDGTVRPLLPPSGSPALSGGRSVEPLSPPPAASGQSPGRIPTVRTPSIQPSTPPQNRYTGAPPGTPGTGTFSPPRPGAPPPVPLGAAPTSTLPTSKGGMCGGAPCPDEAGGFSRPAGASGKAPPTVPAGTVEAAEKEYGNVPAPPAMGE